MPNIDIVLCHPVRTAIGTYGGSLKEVPGRKGPTVFNQDEHNRPDTSAESLARLKPAFRKQGTITAGSTLACLRELGFAEEIVNVEGGAIAHGHPTGASGAVLATRLIHSMQRDGLQRGVATLCIDGGQGIALALELL